MKQKAISMKKQNRPEIRKERFLFLTVFLTGAAILILEILGARLLAPYFGVGLYVWSALITVTLMALAFGYWLGGRVADAKPDIKHLYFIVFLAGVIIFFLPIVAPNLMKFLGFLEIRLGALASGLILFGPPLTLLGMIMPYAVRISTFRLDVLGRRAGGLFAMSTAGSCFGALVTGFFLIPFFGVSRVFYFLSAALLILWVVGIFLFYRHKKNLVKISVLFFPPFLIAFFFVSQPAKSSIVNNGTVIYESDSLRGHLSVVDKGYTRWLAIDGMPNSGMDRRSGFSVLAYTYYFEAMNCINPGAKSALVIGLGAGSISKRFSAYGLRTDSVEIDPGVAEVAKKYFGFKTYKGNLYIEDGRRYVCSCAEKYNFIILDATFGDLLPEHLYTLESFREMRIALKKGGILGVNYVGFARGKDSLPARSIYRTLKKIFRYVKVYFHGSAARIGNVIFLASGENLEPGRAFKDYSLPEINKILEEMSANEINYREEELRNSAVLTDDRNPIQLWNLKAAVEWRKNALTTGGW